MPDAVPEPTSLPVVEDAVCLACGCLCDDIRLTVDAEGRRIVETRNACDLGRDWWLADHEAADRPEATIDGQAATPEEAIKRAASILKEARSPVLLGLTGTTVEAVAEAVALADALGAIIEPGHAGSAAAALAAFRRVGKVTASLGEVRNRADVVVFWGVDPVATHPRHWDRYSVAPVGRFVPRGRADRTILVADEQPTATAARADSFQKIDKSAYYDVFSRLRAIVRGVPLDEPPTDEETAWADILKRARYGAFFYDKTLGDAATVEAAFALVRDLNLHTRFVAIGLGGPGNPAGAEAVLTWQAGWPLGVDFARGIPESGSAVDRLERGEADAALIVTDRWDNPPPSVADRLATIPTIRIAPDADAPDRPATVGLACATPGIHTTGRVIRVDGVWLPLRPALPPARLTDLEWLRRLREAIAP